jgi:hypothetical protein
LQTITTFDNTAEGWERSLYAFLAEKERWSGSRRTVVGYSRMLQHFFGSVGKLGQDLLMEYDLASSEALDRAPDPADRA